MLPFVESCYGFIESRSSLGLVLSTLELLSTLIGLFGLIVSTQESIEGLFKLSLLCTFHVKNANGLDLLM